MDGRMEKRKDAGNKARRDGWMKKEERIKDRKIHSHGLLDG